MGKYTTENIDRYIHGEMSPSEKQQWNKEIVSDKDLEKEINLYKELEKALREKDIILLRKALIIIEKEYHKKQNDNTYLCEPSQKTA